MTDDFINKPSQYYDAYSITDRGYFFYRTNWAESNEKWYLLPEGAKFISSYYTKATELDDNLIVFYTIGDKQEFVAVRRYIGGTPFRPYILSLSRVEQLTKCENLPDIFESPYGRLIKMSSDRQIRNAERGYGCRVKSLHRFASIGGKDHIKGHIYFVRFHNGETDLGVCIESYREIGPFSKDSANDWYQFWLKNEGLLPVPEVPQISEDTAVVEDNHPQRQSFFDSVVALFKKLFGNL